MPNSLDEMTNLTESTALILAGGLGTRLRGLVPDKPKVLAEVRGKPFIYYLLDQLLEAETRTIVISTGYLASQIEERIGDKYYSASIIYSVEDSPAGTGGALRLALPSIRSRTVLVMNGDSYCGVNLKAMATFHDKSRASGTIAVTRIDDTKRFGQVEAEEDGLIHCFKEKGQASGPGLVNAGIYLLNIEIIESIPVRQRISLEQETFPAWVGRGLRCYRTMAQLWDIGVPEAFAKANAEFEMVAPRLPTNHHSEEIR